MRVSGFYGFPPATSSSDRRDQGGLRVAPRCQADVSAARSSRVPLPPRAPPRARRMRRRLRLVQGHATPLRHRATLASYRSGGHAIWWTVEAATEGDALRLLPPTSRSAPPSRRSPRSRSRDQSAPSNSSDQGAIQGVRPMSNDRSDARLELIVGAFPRNRRRLKCPH